MISTLKFYFTNANNRQLILLYSIIGLLVAWRINYIHHGWVNNDFVLYHEAARLFAVGSWSEGFNVFKWPLYSLLIALVSKITHADIHLSAQVLIVGLFFLTSYSFLSIINLAGGNKLTISLGALILLSSSYIVGDVLPMLLRDPGFWAFNLTSLVFFIRFYRYRLNRDAIFWQVAAILATLFRIEGITYQLLLPLLFLSDSSLTLKARCLLIIQANQVNIAIALLLLILFTTIPTLSTNDLGRANEIWTLFDYRYKEMINEFSKRADLLGVVVLKGHFDNLTTIGLLSALLGMLLIKCASTAGWLNVALVLLRKSYQDVTIKKDTEKIFLWVIALAILNIIVILLSVFLVVGRYTAPLGFMIMIFASFSLAHLANMYIPRIGIKSWHYYFFIFALIFMSLSLVKNLLPKNSAFNYQQNAVTWLKEHNKSKKPVFYDNSRIRYYAGAPFIGTWGDSWKIVTSAIEDKSIKENEFLLISGSEKYSERLQIIKEKLPEFIEVKRFSPPKANKSVIIYQRK